MNIYHVTADLKGHRGRPAAVFNFETFQKDFDAANEFARKVYSRDIRFGRVNMIRVILSGIGRQEGII